MTINFDQVQLHDGNPEPRCPCVLLLDTSGSMTGAPKLASISLLERLETVRRGVYAGALGYLDLRGGLDLSVVIRTILWQEGRAHLHVGGGVVADSSPEAEYLESLDKAKAPLAALDEALGLDRA